MIRLIRDAPYSEAVFGRRAVVEQDHLLMMQIALTPGQEVPLHKANSNVHLLILDGAVTVFLDGTPNRLERGDLLPVEFQTPMRIVNDSAGNSTFSVIKTPHPRLMEGKAAGN